MDDRTRQQAGGLLIALALVIVGVALGGTEAPLGAVLLFVGALLGVVCLLNLGLDLMKPRDRG